MRNFSYCKSLKLLQHTISSTPPTQHCCKTSNKSLLQHLQHGINTTLHWCCDTRSIDTTTWPCTSATTCWTIDVTTWITIDFVIPKLTNYKILQLLTNCNPMDSCSNTSAFNYQSHNLLLPTYQKRKWQGVVGHPVWRAWQQ